jgi:hypothetical protein
MSSPRNTDQYDPTGEGAIWQAAAQLVEGLKLDQPPVDDNAWNAALDQAARALENEARAIRQKNGMYFRVISGHSANGKIDGDKG